MVHPDGVHPHTALTREQPLSSDPLLPSPLSHPPLESVSFTAHGEKEFLRVSRSSVSDAQAGAPGAAWVCHCGPARGCPPGGALTTSGPWASVRRPWTLVRVNGEVCEKTQPASSQLQSLPLFIKEQVGSCPPPHPRGCRRGSGAEGWQVSQLPATPPRRGGLRSGLKEDLGTVGFVFTGGGQAGQGPTSQSGGSLSQKQGGIDPQGHRPQLARSWRKLLIHIEFSYFSGKGGGAGPQGPLSLHGTGGWGGPEPKDAVAFGNFSHCLFMNIRIFIANLFFKTWEQVAFMET